MKIAKILLVSLFLAACSHKVSEEVTPNSLETSNMEIVEDGVVESDKDMFTLEEVSNHKTEDDCWMAIDNKVYDVTEFVSNHSGGKTILAGCGIDATELFETRPMGSKTPHSDNARNIREDYYIGDLK